MESKTLINKLSLWLMLLLFNHVSFAAAPSITGLWETVDDRTGQKKAVVSLYIKNKKLCGKIVKVYWKAHESRLCNQCKGELHHQSIEGLPFLWGLSKHSRLIWEKGSILDPHNGKIYRVRIKKNKDKLLVRAYLGRPILGRTQIWQRLSKV